MSLNIQGFRLARSCQYSQEQRWASHTKYVLDKNGYNFFYICPTCTTNHPYATVLNQGKRFIIPLLILCLTLLVAVVPDIVSDDMKAWCLSNIGPSYPRYLIGFFVVASVVLAVLQSDWGKGLFSSSKGKTLAIAKIPWSPQTAQIVREARAVLKDAKPEEALSRLYDLKSAGLDEKLSMLSIKLAEYRQSSGIGTLTSEQKETTFSRISEAIFHVIKQIENQLTEGEKENQDLRGIFRNKYRKRLENKLAFGLPINLRRFTTTEGTSEQVASTFIAYSSEDIKEEIGKTFQKSLGRLLIVGEPGAGKTALLLQLADQLFDLEKDALPIVLNLATWQSSFGKFETWLNAVLDSELSIEKASAKIVLRQSKLIFLLDGLDELKEDAAINSCLVAIANYGSDNKEQRFVVTCRIEEYKRVSADARVWLQIQVGPLQAAQLESEIVRLGSSNQDALLMLQATKEDALLQQVVENPFYLNTLELLFRGALPVFTTQDLKGRKNEIKDKFIIKALQTTKNKFYEFKSSKRWLSFLASRMNEQNMVIFELRDLQYDWWQGWTWWNRIVANLIGGLVFTLALGLAVGLVKGLVIGLTNPLSFVLLDVLLDVLFFVLFFGLAFGLAGGLVSGLGVFARIETRDTVHWSVENYIKYLKSQLVGILIFLLGVILILLLGGGLVRSALFVMLVSGLFVILVSGLFIMIQEEFSDFIQITSPYQRFNASKKVLYFSILQHRHLLRLLSRKDLNLLPYDLVPFLNEMTDRNLLESDGATWRFRHRLIQDWFAEEWKKEQNEPIVAN